MINEFKNARSHKELQKMLDSYIDKSNLVRKDTLKAESWDDILVVGLNNANALYRAALIKLKNDLKAAAIKEIVDVNSGPSVTADGFSRSVASGLLAAFLNASVKEGITWGSYSDVNRIISQFIDITEQLKKNTPLK